MRKRGRCYFLVPNKKVTKEVGLGSEGSAAGGRRSDLSEWQRSASRKPALSGEADAGHRNRENPTKIRRWDKDGTTNGKKCDIIVSSKKGKTRIC